MKKILLPLLMLLTGFSAFSQSTIVKYLSGTDKDHTVAWDFYCTFGRKSGEWTKIPVPSNWEQQGFGNYNYGHDKNRSNEQGLYRHEFASANWADKKVFIVFEGSMTDTKVMVNGRQAGPVHQGSFYRFKYDITDLVKVSGTNLLEVTVSKVSSNASVNSAERESDFWIFGGIYRPVYLEIVPETYIERTAVNAKADGTFEIDVFAQNLKGDETIEAQVQKLSGENVGKPFSMPASTTQVQLKSTFNKPLLWSAEFPNLYQVVLSIKNKQGTIIHKIKEKFGFRTVELRPKDGFYVNGAKVIMKGSNRHSFWPKSGRTLSHEIHVLDARLMKEMNMNAVRMSHYPPDADFLDVCDSIGLYVLDELTGWQTKYDTEVGRKLVKELVIRDVNHPSVVFWDNGNEGGWNRDLDNDYALYDPQRRTVIHPYEKFNDTDTRHYQDYQGVEKTVAEGQEVYFPTEFMHGLYDGGAGAALDDYWRLMLKHPHFAGGFIWAFIDEAVIRTDKDGSYDTDGNHGADGIVGPHREKEASYYVIKEIWSPVYIEPKPINASFKGQISIENRYSFTNLNQCTFKWKLASLPSAKDQTTEAKIQTTGTPAALNLGPGEKGMLNLKLPSNWRKSDVLYLTAYGPYKEEIFTWSWIITPADEFTKRALPSPDGGSSNTGQIIGTTEETETKLRLTCDGINYYFDKTTGYIEKVVKPSATISLSRGPILAGVDARLKSFSHRQSGRQHIVEADYQGAGSLTVKWIFTPGSMVKLEYKYSQQGDFNFMGITFDYPEEKITGMKWLGRGPYKVWQNRLKGQQFGVWHKAYNNATTGETFGYPEFKGYHAEVNWVTIENKESPFTVYTEDQNLFLQMLKPNRAKDSPQNNNVEPSFPEGSIGFLNAISAIGNKFQSASKMGPNSQKTKADGQPISGTLWFDFK